MRRRRFSLCLIVCFFALTCDSLLLARGQAWAFLGYTQLDGRQDHTKVQVTRRDSLFRTIRLRVSDAIFFDRLVVHFADGTSKKFDMSERILPEGRKYFIELDGERLAVESVEFWYYQEPWEHNPLVSLYGISAGSVEAVPAGAESLQGTDLR